MKKVLLVSALVCAAPFVQAEDTAYSALRVVGKSSGADALNRVLEVRGRSGMPVPAVWKIVLNDPRAHGGLREMDVQRGKIISERAPAARAVGSAMNFNQLNLDSEGAFTIANQQAQKAGVPFDHVDYVLKSGTNGGAPVWELQLLAARNGRVASLQIAADSGTVLSSQGLTVRGNQPYPRVPPEVAAGDRDYVGGGSPDPGREDVEREPAHEPIRDVPSFFRRTGEHFEKRGRQIKRFFTGD